MGGSLLRQQVGCILRAPQTIPRERLGPFTPCAQASLCAPTPNPATVSRLSAVLRGEVGQVCKRLHGRGIRFCGVRSLPGKSRLDRSRQWRGHGGLRRRKCRAAPSYWAQQRAFNVYRSSSRSILAPRQSFCCQLKFRATGGRRIATLTGPISKTRL